jgi:hypothetical protein
VAGVLEAAASQPEDPEALIAEPRMLSIRAATLFGLTESGRLLHENSPDRSPAPRMWLAGTAAGNAVRIRADVREETADAIEELVAREPPLSRLRSVPAHLDEYLALLGADAHADEVGRGVAYTFPDSLQCERGARVVTSGTPEGAQLLARLEAGGMPADLVDMGFVGTTHMWAPWCVALQEGTIASIAFAARVSPLGAEVGVVTRTAFRGRGLAAATTAAWASLPSLSDRVLFYSTTLGNLSSQRVAGRLRLPFLGPSLSIG